MSEIRGYQVPAGSAALWWLGQSGYVFKTPGGTVAAVDAYLTNSCEGLAPGLNLSRRVPVPVEPEELDVDVFLCTHNHQDHTDPETIRRLRQDRMQFAGPHPSCAVFRELGVASERITATWPDGEFPFGDLGVRGTFALPTDDTDLNHMGFLFEFRGGPKIWLTGDTDACDLLYGMARQKPDVMIAVINGNFNNLSCWEAAALAAKVKPKIAIPSHYDLFPDNSVDPQMFRAALQIQAPEVQYLELQHGKAYLLGGSLS